MKPLAAKFVREVKSGKIVYTHIHDANYEQEVEPIFDYENGVDADGRELHFNFFTPMPLIWDAVAYPNDAGYFLHKTNGVVTKFVSHNNSNTRGAYAFGVVKTTLGDVDVKGGWSSRPGILLNYTGKRVLQVCFGRGLLVHLNYDVAEAIADHLDLRIGVSGYSCEDETHYAFFHK